MSLFIGIMSGTSLDGIDVALVDLSENRLNLVAAKTFSFAAPLRRNLLRLIENGETSLRLFGQTDIALGHAYSDAVKQLLGQASTSAEDVCAIGCHGQTIYHAPDIKFAFSLQIGNAHVLAEQTGITTVTDFRQRDIVLGGQGAPLVPAFHQNMFTDSRQFRVIANIGGISNITLLPTDRHSAVSGFDTGPGNILLDQWYQQHQQGLYDKDGLWAATGTVNTVLLQKLLTDPYFSLSAPKSTGREYFNLAWLNDKMMRLKQTVKPEDVQRTLVELTVISLTRTVKQSAADCSEVYLCGGGVHHPLLMAGLTAALGPRQVNSTESIGLAPDWVEACAFAWLAKQTTNHKTANLPAVTGASKTSILGAIYPANK